MTDEQIFEVKPRKPIYHVLESHYKSPFDLKPTSSSWWSNLRVEAEATKRHAHKCYNFPARYGSGRALFVQISTT